MSRPIPIIDLFAGPGGLGEGFERVVGARGSSAFQIKLSIEMEAHAHRTLTLRSFYRQFEHDDVPIEYFRYLQGKLDRDALFRAFPEQSRRATEIAWQAELGKAPEHEVDQRVRDALGGTRDWVLIGGPPCQAYSLVGRARTGKSNQADKRHFLYRQYLRILNEHRPAVFVMENVKGLLSAHVRQESIVQQILEDLTAAGYRLHALAERKKGLWSLTDPKPEDFVVRCEDFGIPQCRHRVIIVGSRSDLQNSRMKLEAAQRPITVEEALDGLPALQSRVSTRAGADKNLSWRETIVSEVQGRILREVRTDRRDLVSYVCARLEALKESRDSGAMYIPWGMAGFFTSVFARKWCFSGKLRGVCNHEARSHMSSDLARYFFCACFAEHEKRSPVLKDFPQKLLPEHKNAHSARTAKTFVDRFKVQMKDRPASTITAHISKDGHYFVHPDPLQCRSLTVREAARIQTFPDDYFFEGPRTEQYRQVGNAVPPLLAYQIATEVLGFLKGRPEGNFNDGHRVEKSAQLEHVTHPE